MSRPAGLPGGSGGRGGRRVFTSVSFSTAAAILLAVVLGTVGAARAENECGQPEPGTPTTCSPSNYDADAEGSIVYRLTKMHSGDIDIQFVDGLSIRYDSNNLDDDRLLFPIAVLGLPDFIPLYAAADIRGLSDYAGNLSFFSSADVDSHARGFAIVHEGTSGALRTEISGGNFLIDTKQAFSHGILSSHSGVGEGRRDHNLIVRNVVIDSKLPANPQIIWAMGILGLSTEADAKYGGNFNVIMQDSRVKVRGNWPAGIAGICNGNGNINLNVEGSTIDVVAVGGPPLGNGQGGPEGVSVYNLASGNSNLHVRNSDIKISGLQDVTGIAQVIFPGASGNTSMDVQDVNMQVIGEDAVDGIYVWHQGTAGDLDMDLHRVNVDVVAKADVKPDSPFRAGSGVAVHIRSRGNGSANLTARDIDLTVNGIRQSSGIVGFKWDLLT